MAILDYFLNENANLAVDSGKIASFDGGLTYSLVTYGDKHEPENATLDINPQSKIWVSFSFHAGADAYISNFDDKDLMVIKNGSDTLLAFRCVLNGSLAIEDHCQSDGVAVSNPIESMTKEVFTRVDIEFEPSSDGVIRVYVDGVLEFERTGDIQKNGADQVVTQLYLAPIATTTKVYYKNFFACDGDTPSLGVEMVHRAVVSDGKHTDFSGNFADVAKTGINDATYMTGGETAKQSFAIEALPAGYETHNVVGVGVYMRGLAEADGVIESSPLICSATTESEVVGSGKLDNKVQFTPLREIFHTAPDGGAWDQTKLADTEIGVVNV